MPGALDLVQPGESVLIIGTGLTMMDIALDLLNEREVASPLHAVSPRGLLPRDHRPGAIPLPPSQPALALDGGSSSLTRHVRAFRAHVAASAADGVDWREVIGSIRRQTPRIWQALPRAEQSRFLRHVRPFWEVHRHRAAPETSFAIAGMVESGMIRITAGRVVGFREDSDGASVSVRPRSAHDLVHISVARVINCTGPAADVRYIRDPLIRSLVDRGYMRSDPHGLGADTTSDGNIVDRHGRPSDVLFLVGPLLKARFWESTAVPELREHAASLADRLAAAVGTPERPLTGVATGYGSASSRPGSAPIVDCQLPNEQSGRKR